MKTNKFVVLLLILIFSIPAYSGQTTLDSPLAGSWYPASSSVLKKQMEKYFDNVKEKKLEDVIALILPHAGYAYSGQTAAYGIKEIIGNKYSRVVILGPSHQQYMKNKICIPKDVNAFKTPIGTTPLDKEFINKLKKYPEVISNDHTHYNEHSVQIELPLLQNALNQFKFVPIIVGQLDSTIAQKIGDILKSLIDDNTLIIASSDFTHYGQRFRYMPFTLDAQAQEKIKRLDMNAVKEIEDINFNKFNSYIEKTGITVCGSNPISILLAMLPKKTQATLLHYDTSGRQTGDFTNSVSYVSMAFTGKWDTECHKLKTEKAKLNRKSKNDVLTQNDKKSLLKLARQTLVYYMKNKKMPTPEELDIKITSGMRQKMGVFVTLHEHGMLRGCIGEITPTRPLYVAVMHQAVNAALRDHRFPRVHTEEIPNIEFEISALTPPKPVSSYEDIVIGRDGMIISKHGYSSVFLPQVAPEQGWDLAQTLTHLSQKAGLPPNAWKDGASFTTFQAIVFKENEQK
jgi:MEMO1 family protein